MTKTDFSGSIFAADSSNDYMKKWINLSFLLAFLGTIHITLAGGLIIIYDPDEPIPMPRPWPIPRPIPPPQCYSFAPLEVVSHKIDVRIRGQVAFTSIEQEFYNPNPRQLEGTFVFPIPKGAQISRFAMEIGGKPVEAELMAADKARQIYEDIVRKMKDPALLEYADRDAFKVRIFPIEANGRKRVTISYSQLLGSDSGLVNYTYPLSAEKFSAKPLKNLSIKVELEGKQALKTIYSPSHTVEIRRDGETHATVGYEASNIRPETDFQLFFAPERTDVGVNMITYKSQGEDGFFLLLASPGLGNAHKRVMSKDVAFVIDTSGSMVGKKMEQAKKALHFCVENLNDDDRFDIIRFSTETESRFDGLVKATAENRARAVEFIGQLKPIGGTAIDEALRKALALRPAAGDRPYVIIFLTDGQPTVGNTDENQIVSAVTKDPESTTRIFCFGVGTDVNTHLLDKITEATRAFSQYVLPEEDLEVKLSNFFTKIKEPALANPKLTFPGDVRVSGMYPSPLPDLFKGGQLVLLGRYSGSGDATATLQGMINGETRKFDYKINFPDKATDHDFIPRLWATRRIGYLLDENRLHGENKELREEITDLARKYGIVTPYTAYLIVEDEARREVPVAVRSLQRFEEDQSAKETVKKSFASFQMEKAGDSAVAGARAQSSLRMAENAADGSALADAEIQRGMVATAPASVATIRRVAEYTQQTRFVNGRNFFQNGEQWVDAGVQKMSGASPVRILFGSQEYFDLLRKHPEALQWFALGQNIQLVLENTIYEIRAQASHGKQG